MKGINKVLSVLLALIMVISVIPMSSISISAAQTSYFHGGKGTEEEPYLISTKQHLDNVRLCTDAHYKLIKDIVFTDEDYARYSGKFYNSGNYWEPIPVFTGVFDGNHYSIDGLKMNHTFSDYYDINNSLHIKEEYGLFSEMNGKVCNLTLSNTDIKITLKRKYDSGISAYVGAIAGLSGGDILNCSVSGSVTATGATTLASADVGGIVGYSGHNSTISNCTNLATVQANFPSDDYARAGGITASFLGIEIKNCTNFGEIYAYSYEVPYAGGIAAICSTYYYWGNGYSSVISHCYNFGNVGAKVNYTNPTDQESAYSTAAGMLARSYNEELSLTDCGNFGEITSRGPETNAAGVIALGYKASENEVAQVKRCFNSGSVSVYQMGSEDYAFHEVAGIATFGATIEQCFNSGSLSATGTTILKVGGIATEIFSDIKDSYNCGNITVSGTADSVKVGGIAECVSYQVENCYNVGELPKSNGYGIANSIYNGSTALENDDIYIIGCYYLNNVSTGVYQINGDFTVQATQKTSAELKKQSTFKEFDFNDVWTMPVGDYGYPQLKHNRQVNGTKEDICAKRGNHTLIKNAVTKEATCLENGNVEYICQVCEAKSYVTIDAPGHNIVSQSGKEPTCTKAGWNAYETCSECEYTTYKEISPTGHSHNAAVTEPTCTEQGFTTYTCHCGDNYVDDYVDATGHDHTSEITTPATHLTTGVMTFTCHCGDTYTEIIEKIAEHDYKTVVTAPTCTEKGYTTYTCECGDTYVADYVDATGHDHTSEITTPATHLTTGVMTFTCGCGDTYTETIEKIAEHDYKTVVTAPTCTEKGYTTYTCECGDTYVSNYKGATGHDYDSGIVTTKPTCTKTGIKTFTCGNCGDTYTEEVKALGHDHKSEITTPATHLTTGVMTFTCGCGDTYTETIDKIATHNHTYVVTEPTCTEKGYTTYTCECGDTYVADYVDATGHSDTDNDGNCNVCDEHLCDHACHKSGITGFFWKIVCFFSKLFGANKFCECGTAHY